MRIFAWIVLLSSLCVAAPAHALKLPISEDGFLNLDVLMQVQGQSVEKGAPDGGWSKDAFVRRVRLLAFGDLSKNVSFFFETDQPNLGRNGDWSTPFFVQDAFMSFKVADGLIVDTGMVLLPFTRHSMMGAIALNAMDYHTKLIRFPDGSTKVFRDAGLQLRGNVLDQKVHYRAGVFAGAQGGALEKDAVGKVVTAMNPEDLPRATGHVRYAVLGTETDFFFKGMHFAAAPILSFGVGADLVPGAVLKRKAVLDATGAVTQKGEVRHHLGVAGDMFLELPLGADNALVAQGTVLYYDAGGTSKNTGVGGLAEIGYRWKAVEPVVTLDYFKADVDAADYLGTHVGLNWWLAKHASNLKLDVAFEKTGDLSDAKFNTAVTLQAQLFL